jgi:hypothetical protein
VKIRVAYRDDGEVRREDQVEAWNRFEEQPVSPRRAEREREIDDLYFFPRLFSPFTSFRDFPAPTKIAETYLRRALKQWGKSRLATIRGIP